MKSILPYFIFNHFIVWHLGCFKYFAILLYYCLHTVTLRTKSFLEFMMDSWVEITGSKGVSSTTDYLFFMEFFVSPYFSFLTFLCNYFIWNTLQIMPESKDKTLYYMLIPWKLLSIEMSDLRYQESIKEEVKENTGRTHGDYVISQ